MKNTLQRNSSSFLLIIAMLLLASCTERINKVPDPPSDLIHRDTMVLIIMDLRLMDAVMIKNQREGRENQSKKKYQMHNSILQRYNITREQFETSFDYYEKDIEVLDKIYADAVEQLKKMEGEIKQKETKKEPVKQE